MSPMVWGAVIVLSPTVAMLQVVVPSGQLGLVCAWTMPVVASRSAVESRRFFIGWFL